MPHTKVNVFNYFHSWFTICMSDVFEHFMLLIGKHINNRCIMCGIILIQRLNVFCMVLVKVKVLILSSDLVALH